MPRASRFDEEKQAEIIRYLVSGKSQRETSAKYDYAQSAVNNLYKKVKAMVKDYATNHSVEETVSHFEKWDISEEWLNENDILCTPPVKEIDKSFLVKKYQSGVSMAECAEIYDISETEVREILDEFSAIIREDKPVRTDFIQDNIEDLPPIHTYDIVYVKNAKLSYDRDRGFNAENCCRPAIVISPQDFMNNSINKSAEKNKGHLTVIYGTTRIVADNKYNIILPKFYTGKEGQFSVCSVDSVSINDIDIPKNGRFSHLNDYDISRLKEKLYCYFMNDNDYPHNENVEFDVTESVKYLFEHSFDRNQIHDFFKMAELDVDKKEIQSILDRAGYGGIKLLPAKSQDIETINVDSTDTTELKTQIEVLQAKLSVYEKFYEKTNVSVNI